MPLKLGEGLLRETFATLRECGANRNECVVYWAGPRSDGALLDTLIHPVHIARPGYYELDQEWLNGIWFDLAERELAIRVQIHTHGGRACHSELDDGYPLLQTAGFLSLVLPRFARGSVGFCDSYLAELGTNGSWSEKDPFDTFEVTQ